MYPARFEYYAPASLDEAFEILERAGVQELTRVVPLVQRLRRIDALVALEADQVGAEDPRKRLPDLGLPDPCLALEEQRPPHGDGQEDRGRKPAVREVRLPPQGPLDVGHRSEAHVPSVTGDTRW